MSEAAHREGNHARHIPRVPPITATFATSVMILMLNVFTGVILARTLGPDDRGVLAAAILWPTLLATFASLGVPDAVTYYTARGETNSPVVASSLALALGLSLLATGVGLLVVAPVIGIHDASVAKAMVPFFAFIPLNLTAQALLGYVIGKHRFGRYNLVRVSVAVTTAIGLSVLALTHRLSVASALVTYLLANTATVVAALLAAGRVSALPRLDSVRELVAYGWRSQVGTISLALTDRLDQLMISLLLPSAQLGLYVVAVTVTSATTLIGASVAAVALPSLAACAGAERVRLARRLLLLGLTLSALSSAAVGVGLDVLIRGLFGARFVPSEAAAMWLLAATVFWSENLILASILRAAGVPMAAGRAQLASLLVTAAALCLLLPSLGLVGAAIASLLAYAFLSVLLCRAAMNELCPANPRDLLIPRRGDLMAIVRLLITHSESHGTSLSEASRREGVDTP